MNSKKMKKFGNVFLVLIMICMVMTLNSVNAEVIVKDSTGHSFNSDWEERYSLSGGKIFKYGYNTFLINEDYAHCNKDGSQTRITNDNGTVYANAAHNTTWSKVEVRHVGTYVIYGVVGA